RYLTSGAVSAVTVDNSAGHSPPVTHGVQSTAGALKAGILSDSSAARRRRCRAVFRPKIATDEAYRHDRFPYSGLRRRAQRGSAWRRGSRWVSVGVHVAQQGGEFV